LKTPKQREIWRVARACFIVHFPRILQLMLFIGGDGKPASKRGVLLGSDIGSQRVFVSHSSLDREIAEKILNHLESEGIPCWVSHRDIAPGSDWAETIYDAIAGASVMVLLFTGNANESRQVRNELDIATNLKVPIIPIRLDGSDISKGLRYFTNSHQWLEGVAGGKRLDTRSIVAAVKNAVSRSDSGEPAQSASASGGSTGSGKVFLPILGLAAAALAAILLLGRREALSEPSGLLFSLVAGGTDSWNYATDVAAAGDMGFFATGTWDWGFWSEAWVARFDSTLALLWNWSDSLAGECGPKILLTDDNGVVVAFGEYADFEYQGFWVRAVRLDSLGTVIWDSRKRIEWPDAIQPHVGELAWNHDGSISLALTLRVIDTARSNATHIIRIDPGDGGMTWRAIPDRMECVAFLPLPDGGAFHVYHEYFTKANGIELLSPGGDVLNSVLFGDELSQATCAALTDDGGLLVAVTGDRYGPGNGDLWLMKFSGEMELLWKRVHGGGMLDRANRIQLLPDGGFIVAGGSRSFGDGSLDGWLIRVNSRGEMVWQSSLITRGSSSISSVDMDADGSFLVAGYTSALRGERDALIARVSSGGVWADSVQLGLDILYENWGKGFLDQSVWLMGRNRNYTPVIRADSSAGGFSLDVKEVPLLLRERFEMSPGFSVSAEILVPDLPSVGGLNWVALGFTERDINAFHLDPASTPQHQLRWEYTKAGDFHDRGIEALCLRDDSSAGRRESDQGWLTRGIPQRLTMETCRGSVRYLLNDSLFFQTPEGMRMPDSIGVYLWGSSVSLPHSIREVRVYRRRW